MKKTGVREGIADWQRALTLGTARRQLGGMDLPDDEQAFLRDLVKASRQKVHSVKWTDRDGSKRQTVLSQPEVVRLNTIASRLRTSKEEVLRQAAHVPVPKLPPKPPAAGSV